MKFFLLFIMTIPVFGQGSFTRYYNIVSDDLGLTTVTEFPSLETSVMSNIKLDGKPICLPKWVKETTSYDIGGTVYPSVIEPVVIDTVTINSVSPGSGTVFTGTALYNVESKNLNFFQTDDDLSVAILSLFNQKPCQTLVGSRILVAPPSIISGTTTYWFNVPQSPVTVTFGN